MTDSPPLFIPEKQSSTTKFLIGPRAPVEASTVQTEPKWKPPFFEFILFIYFEKKNEKKEGEFSPVLRLSSILLNSTKKIHLP